MSAQKDQDALHLFRAAVPLDKIREKQGFKTVTQVEAAIRRAMETNARRDERADLRRLEVERIDALYRAAYPKALQGDWKAAELCLKLSDQRSRLLDDQGPETGLAAAYAEALTGLHTTTADSALVETGRAIAAQIDEAITHGQPLERTKALYLVPHLMNVLRELGATPAAREALGQAVPSGDREKNPIEVILEARRRKQA